MASNLHLKCLLCNGSVLFDGVTAKRYRDHLVSEHNITTKYVEVVLNSTLKKFKRDERPQGGGVFKVAKKQRIADLEKEKVGRCHCVWKCTKCVGAEDHHMAWEELIDHVAKHHNFRSVSWFAQRTEGVSILVRDNKMCKKCGFKGTSKATNPLLDAKREISTHRQSSEGEEEYADGIVRDQLLNSQEVQGFSNGQRIDEPDVICDTIRNMSSILQGDLGNQESFTRDQNVNEIMEEIPNENEKESSNGILRDQDSTARDNQNFNEIMDGSLDSGRPIEEDIGSSDNIVRDLSLSFRENQGFPNDQGIDESDVIWKGIPHVSSVSNFYPSPQQSTLNDNQGIDETMEEILSDGQSSESDEESSDSIICDPSSNRQASQGFSNGLGIDKPDVAFEACPIMSNTSYPNSHPTVPIDHGDQDFTEIAEKMTNGREPREGEEELGSQDIRRILNDREVEEPDVSCEAFWSMSNISHLETNKGTDQIFEDQDIVTVFDSGQNCALDSIPPETSQEVIEVQQKRPTVIKKDQTCLQKIKKEQKCPKAIKREQKCSRAIKKEHKRPVMIKKEQKCLKAIKKEHIRPEMIKKEQKYPKVIKKEGKCPILINQKQKCSNVIISEQKCPRVIKMEQQRLKMVKQEQNGSKMSIKREFRCSKDIKRELLEGQVLDQSITHQVKKVKSENEPEIEVVKVESSINLKFEKVEPENRVKLETI